jgi:glycosyltransferase involved in cell wall biosynthesis
MRISQVAPPWIAVPPVGYGGIEWVVSLLADGLADRGHDVTLFATGDSSTRARLEFAFETAPGPPHINSIWHDTVHTLRAFRDPGRFDLYHVHSAWSALAAGVVAGVPVVVTLHGSFSPGMRRLFREVSDGARFVAISEAQRASMPELPYAGVVYNGIDLERYPVCVEKEDFLLFLGRAAPEKGLRRAILAARSAGLPLKATVKVAHHDEFEYWRNQIEPLLGDDVEVLHEVPHGAKVELLQRARALLFPIDWEEPFGLVMAEAMACGTPVVATPRGSVPEVVVDGETGFIVPVDEYPETAAQRVGDLWSIEPKACRERVERLFSQEAMVRGYERAYQTALAS